MSSASEYSGELRSEKSANVVRVDSDKEKGTVNVASEGYGWNFEDAFTAEDLEVIFAHVDDRTFEEWLDIFREAVVYYKNDPGISTTRLEQLHDLAEGPLDGQTEEEWHAAVKFEAFVIHEWSIYPEVRAVTRPPFLEDDDSEEYQSFRAMASGTLWGAAGAVISTFFEPRWPTLSISSSSLQIVIAVSGHLMGKLPRMQIPLGFGRKFVLNTGKPWSYREQVLAMLAMAVVDGSPYVQDTLISQANSHFYNFHGANSFGYIILLVLSTAFMGFGVGGIFRSAVIYPSQMVYYSLLPTLALSRTLVKADVRESVNGWKLKRWEFFLLVSTLFFGWYWITNILFGFMQFFTWMCWAAPDNLNVNVITGAYSGLGLNPFPSFDPSIFGAFGGVAVPVWAYTNRIIGICISFFAVCIMWWTNVVNTGHLPINSNSLYDNQGEPWQVSEVLNSETRKLDENKFQNYSFPYWCAGNVVTYGSFFMIYPGGFLYGWLNHTQELLHGIKSIVTGLKILPGGRRAIDNFNDPFSRRMQKYKEVPEWWFLLVLLGSLGMAIGTVEGYRFSETPVWTIFLGVGLACVFLPMVSALMARSTYSYETNVLYELIVGYALPGNGNAILVGKAYATNFFGQAENWITNQKMAHYCGIAPRTLFWAQCVSTVITSFVQAGIITWQLGGGIHDMCDIKNKQLMKCQNTRTYFNASVMWGVIGPKRVFKSVYPKLKWCFLIGACYPIPFWVFRRFGPMLANKLNLRKGTWTHYFISGACLRYVNEIIILIGCIGVWGPSNWSYVLVDYYVCLFFGLVVKKKWPHWWSKYAYLIVAACSNGIGWAGFFNFWATQYHHIVNVEWWGNDASDNTLDYNGLAIRLPINATTGDYFGPRKGHFL